MSMLEKNVFQIAEEKILGVYFDNQLNFKYHLSKMCKSASQKLHALARISTLMSFNQMKIIMNAFITSQFNYYPLIWMCHSRTLETLKIVYRENDSSFETLLKVWVSDNTSKKRAATSY